MLIIKRRPIHETLANRRRCRGTDDHAGRMRAKSAYVPTQAAGNPAAAQTQIQGPAVTGSVNIRQRIALPPDAVLTVTLSDASLADAPSKVIAQRAVRTEGQQAPFSFTLPYNPSDIQPNARIILSAAVTVKGRLMFITDTIRSGQPQRHPCRSAAGSGSGCADSGCANRHAVILLRYSKMKSTAFALRPKAVLFYQRQP